LSRRPNNSRLQRREERAARLPSGAPRPRRERPPRPSSRAGGLLGGIPVTAVAAAVGAFVLIAGLVYAVTQADNPTETSVEKAQDAQLDDDPNIPGTYIPPHPGADGQAGTRDDRSHMPAGTSIPICTQAQLDAKNYSNPLCYHSNPPTSGPHSETPAQFRNLQNPARKEDVLHSMEHGGVFIWYNTSDQAAIDLIKSVVDDNVDRRRFVGSTVYTEMEPETIAITSWTRLDKFPVSELTKERLQRFINENHKRFNPEGF